MHFVLSLLAIAGAVAATAWVCARIDSWDAARLQRPEREGPGVPGQLPRGHRPPPGLGPLSPSERFLTQEAARGLRELQLFLVDKRA